MDKKSKKLFLILFMIVFASIWLTYQRTMVDRNFEVVDLGIE